MPLDADLAARFDPERPTLITLGVGYAFTSVHFHTSFLVVYRGEVTLVDAPAPLRRIFRDAAAVSGLPVTIEHVDHVILTHLHGDHCNGIEELGFWRRYRSNGAPRPALYMLPELRHGLEQRMNAAMAPSINPDETASLLGTFYDVRALVEGTTIPVGKQGMELEIHPTEHFIPCAGFRLRAGGRQLGYSADTSFSKPLFSFLEASDLILHECGPGPGHTPPEAIRALPDAVKQRLRLVHVPDDYDPAWTGVEALREGEVLLV